MITGVETGSAPTQYVDGSMVGGPTGAKLVVAAPFEGGACNAATLGPLQTRTGKLPWPANDDDSRGPHMCCNGGAATCSNPDENTCGQTFGDASSAYGQNTDGLRDWRSGLSNWRDSSATPRMRHLQWCEIRLTLSP